MRKIQVEVAVIGAGTAGLGARRTAEKNGATTVLIEDGPYGTTCARVGCMPSKLLIAAADAAHEARHADRFGVHAGPLRIDGPAVLDRVRRERDRFAGFVVDATERIPEDMRVRGRARFVGPSTLQVDDHTRVEAGAVIVATGSAPWLPPPLRPVAEHLLTNEQVFELPDLPRSLGVVGLGVIGLELGQAFHRLGVPVQLFSVDQRIGPATDPAILASMREVLGAELALHLDTPIESAEKVDGGIRLRWKDAAGKPVEQVFEKVLAATGRRPAVTGLDLAAAGLSLGRDGLPRFDPRTMQVEGSRIFLAGDAANDRPLLHEAADEGKIAGANAARVARFGPDAARAHERRTPLAIVFSDPQVALVGKSFAELDPDATGIGQANYGDQGRARVMGRNAGLVRIYGRQRDGLIVGAEMFGPAVEHTAHLLAWAVQARLTVTRALEMPFYHPVVEEGIRTALRDLAARLKMADPMEIRCIDCGPGA
ncbi:MAG: dihydrolipoyl dehydrogenase [Myxococcales bacterium]|nr:dihydrolipoyl dehydrogenase [Myxococcales bacterium]